MKQFLTLFRAFDIEMTKNIEMTKTTQQKVTKYNKRHIMCIKKIKHDIKLNKTLLNRHNSVKG